MGLFGPASAAAQGVDIPDSWAGIWEELIGATGVDFELVCEGQITETTANTTCTMTFSSEGFVITTVFETNFTKSGDSYAGTERVSTDYSGEACELVPSICENLNLCTESQITAVRIGPEPPNCVTPVQDMSWGQIKALYE